MKRKLTREEALRLHRQMWSDMQKELGDDPSFGDRLVYKKRWCCEHFPDEKVHSDCFLCEYCEQIVLDDDVCCSDDCIIDWRDPSGKNPDCCRGIVTYMDSPISVILALPERKEKFK